MPNNFGSNAVHPGREPDEGPQYVLRGGAGSVRSLRGGTRLGPNGFGLSVQTTPGISGDALERGGSFPNAQISVPTVRKLEAIPGVTVNAPTPGFSAYHGTVILPNPPPPGLFDAIRDAFTQKPNPYIVPR